MQYITKYIKKILDLQREREREREREDLHLTDRDIRS